MAYLHQLFDTSAELMPLSEHVARLQKLQALYERVVPAQLLAASRVANLKLQTLVVHTDHAAVAAKLKQLEPRIRAEILRHGIPLVEIVFKVQPRRPEPAAPAMAPHEPLSSSTCQTLADTAAALPADSPVRRALERMLTHRP